MAIPTRSDPDVAAFTRQMETQSADAYREWPIFLVVREAQLRELLAATAKVPQVSPGATAGGSQKESVKS